MRPIPHKEREQRMSMRICRVCQTAVSQRGMSAHVDKRVCGTQMACFGIQQRNLARARPAQDNKPLELQLPVKLMSALHGAARDSPAVARILTEDVPGTVGTCSQGTQSLYRARFMVKRKMHEQGAALALAYGDAQSSQELGGSHMTGREFNRQLEQRLGYPPVERVSFCAYCEEVRAVHVVDEDDPLPERRPNCPVCERALIFFPRHGPRPTCARIPGGLPGFCRL